MSAVERLAILVTADGQGAIREFTKVGRAAERELGGAESRADRLGSRMTSAGAVMMGASAVMVAGLWNAGQSAAALEQAVGGTEAVFKDSAGTIKTWAQGAAQSAGLSEEAAMRLSTRLGGALKGLGFDQQEAADQSIKLSQVAADLAATYGGTTSEAVQALGAAFRGEFDPAERFNLFLKQSTVNAKAVEMGLAKSSTEVDAHARAQATLALVMEGSTDAQGQFARETDTTSGRLAIAGAEFENLKAQVGAGFTPVMTAAGDILGGVTTTLKSADEATGGLASQFLGFGSVGLGAAGALTFITGQAIKMRDTFSGLGEKVSSGIKSLASGMGASATTAASLGSSLGMIGSYALPVVGAAAVAGLGIWQLYAAKQQAADQRAKEFNDTLDEQTGAITANTDALVLQKLQDNNRVDNLKTAGVSVRDYTSAIEDNTVAMAFSAKELTDLDSTYGSSAGTRDEIIAKLREEGGARNDLLATIIEAGAADGGLIDQIYEESAAYDDNQAAIRERIIQQEINTGKSRDQAEADYDAAEAAKAHTQAMKDQNDAQKALLDPLFGAIDALEGNRDAQASATKASQDAYFAQVAYNEAVAQHGPNSKEAFDAQQALNQALEQADDSNLTAAKSAMDVDQALRTLSGAVADGTVSWKDAETTLQGWVDKGLITEAQAENVRAKLGEVKGAAEAVPKQTWTYAYANIDGAVQKFNDLLGLLRTAEQGVTVTINGRVGTVRSFGIDGAVPSALAPQRAGGGSVEPWSAYRVHDTNSPEVLSLSDGTSMLLTGAQGGYVTNLGDSKGVGGGSGGRGVTINLYTAPGTPASQIDDMLKLLRQNQGEVQRAIGI